jgi:uncharacterized membrane-anchored protein
MRKIILWTNLILMLAVFNGTIVHKERLLRTGESVLLKLAPSDPRSFLQGDYMSLRYDLAQEKGCEEAAKREGDGCLVITRDEHGVAAFERIHHGEPLAEGEMLLRYRYRGGLRLGAEAFFFQEGYGEYYENARYGELKVAPSGESVLLGLRDGNFKPLDSPRDGEGEANPDRPPGK